MNEELREIIIGVIIFSIICWVAIVTYSPNNDLSPTQEERNAKYNF